MSGGIEENHEQPQSLVCSRPRIEPNTSVVQGQSFLKVQKEVRACYRSINKIQNGVFMMKILCLMLTLTGERQTSLFARTLYHTVLSAATRTVLYVDLILCFALTFCKIARDWECMLSRDKGCDDGQAVQVWI
jgi:hypothetical protein